LVRLRQVKTDAQTFHDVLRNDGARYAKIARDANVKVD